MMLGRIAPADGEVPGQLTLRAERVLRDISYEKQNVRGMVKSLLNEALTLGKPIPRAKATELRDEIIALSRAIEDAEEALVQAIR